MTDFETLLDRHRGPVERFVKFRISNPQDAEDILQETYLAAFQKLHTLRDEEQFKPWLLSIARNKCNDFYRSDRRREELPLETVADTLTASRFGPAERVFDGVALGEEQRELLTLFYVHGYTIEELSDRLGIPGGTVKSRLHTARSRFKTAYQKEYHYGKVDNMMKKLPAIAPAYTIRPVSAEPFPIKWEELMGWFIVPKLGEKLNWAMYDFPSGKRTEYVEMEVTGKAQVHGIEGVEIQIRDYNPSECNRIDDDKFAQRTFVAQLTDTHSRYLAESHVENGVRKFHTFLDTDEFMPNWGFGPDNCGVEIYWSPRGEITRQGSTVTTAEKPSIVDMVGRCEVTIGGRTYDTVCIMDVEDYIEGAVSEQFVDKNGKTVLWRRFNSNNWAYGRYGKLWTELLPDNERLTVNGETYVHWYDCITDYILK